MMTKSNPFLTENSFKLYGYDYKISPIINKALNAIVLGPSDVWTKGNSDSMLV